VFFPLLGTVLRDEQDPFRIVANVAVPRGKADFPVFRSRAHPGAAWWMWDGKREWMAQPGERDLRPRRHRGVRALGVAG
jgi:hypothetical protein